MSVSVAIAESEIAPLSILSLDLESPLDSKDLFCCKPLLGSELPLRTSSTWALMSEATLDPDGALPPTQHHLWVLLFFTSTTQLPAGSQLAGRGDSSSPEAGHGVQCGPASNPTTSWGQATWAAAYNLGVGDGTPRSASTKGSPEEGSGPGVWRIKAFLSAPLVTMKIKIFMDNFPLSGDGRAQNKAVFFLGCG